MGKKNYIPKKQSLELKIKWIDGIITSVTNLSLKYFRFI